EKIFIEHTSLKPTNMPAANVLINTAEGVLNEIYTLDQLRDALHWYRTYTEQIEDQFDLAVEGKTNSLVILEELPKTREIIDQHDEMMDRFEDVLEDFSEETVRPILEDFADVVDRLEASSQVFMEAAEREGKLVCIQCGHANPPTNRTCESCASMLPQMVDPTMFSQSTFELEERSGLEGDEEDDYRMGINTYRLFESAYNFFEGHIDEEAFRNEIEKSRRTVEASEDGVAALTAREITEKQEEMMTPEQLQTFRDSQEMFLETKHLLEEGMDEWLEGLEYFEQYIESRHRPTLETGIQLIFVASQKIHKVHKLGEMAEKTLAEIEDKEREEEAAARQAPPAVAAPTEEPLASSPPAPGPDTYGDGIG
ncbi:MAG: zinc ribbon domain-containing protein, partial [Candidatus Eremiobacteraeota bacterium]|nr:zinc ribbon domain-containing protein [Candidatus Eremiobacteraeota bacterium]